MIRGVLNRLPYLGDKAKLPPYKPLPPAVEGELCEFGACEKGCGKGFVCSSDGVCCERAEKLTEICSVDNHFSADYYYETREIYNISLCEIGCENVKCGNINPCSEGGISVSRIDFPQDEFPHFQGFYCIGGYLKSDSFPRSYFCSDNGRFIYNQQKEIIGECIGDTFCSTQNDGIASCKTTGQLYGCSTNQTRADGFTCTREGLRCSPGAELPKTEANPCVRVCPESGKYEDTYTYDLKIPFDCSPRRVDYYDDICIGSDRYWVYIDDNNQLIQKFIETTDKCVNGQKAAKVGDTCFDEGGTYMRDDGKCLVRCTDGEITNTSPCGKVTIISYNNYGKIQILETLSLLPDYLFNLHFRTFKHLWFPVVEFPEFTKPFFRGLGFAMNYVGISNLGVLNDYDMASELIIHELMHEWAYAKTAVLPPYFPYAYVINPIVSYVRSKGYAPVPQDYLEIVGCDKNEKGYSYKLESITGYAGLSTEKVECGEDFAGSAAWYVVRPCELMEKSPERYEYFKDQVFTDSKTGETKEYLPDGGCVEP